MITFEEYQFKVKHSNILSHQDKKDTVADINKNSKNFVVIKMRDK